MSKLRSPKKARWRRVRHGHKARDFRLISLGDHVLSRTRPCRSRYSKDTQMALAYTPIAPMRSVEAEVRTLAARMPVPATREEPILRIVVPEAIHQVGRGVPRLMGVIWRVGGSKSAILVSSTPSQNRYDQPLAVLRFRYEYCLAYFARAVAARGC